MLLSSSHCHLTCDPHLPACQGIIRVGAVNCDEHDPLSVDYNISGYPTLILFGEDKEKPIEVRGGSGWVDGWMDGWIDGWMDG